MPETTLPQRLLTVEDVAKVLRLGRSKVYELLSRGELRSVTIGSSRRVRPEDLEEYLASLVG